MTPRASGVDPGGEALEALVPDYVKQLSRKGVTVKSLHEEYLREHPDGYMYSNFKCAIRQYKYQGLEESKLGQASIISC